MVATWALRVDNAQPSTREGRANRKLLLTGVSDNVGAVKGFSSVPWPALGKERHFALVGKVPYATKARSQSVSGLELSPTHASLRSQVRS
jgi:hypothetical protein